MISGPWIDGTVKRLRKDLRKPGPVRGCSGRFRAFITMHKSDFIMDMAREDANKKVTYRIDGNPEDTRRYSADRRTVTIWLGR